MGNGDRQQCEAVLKNGDRCTKKAQKNSRFCGTSTHKALEKKGTAASKSRTRAAAIPRTPSEYHPDFKKALKVCIDEGKNPSDNSTKVQWMQCRLRVIVAALEDLRHSADSGKRPVEFSIVHKLPDDPRPIP